jgi:pimeloyl-ACP methyl ester carboxylesterase
MPIPIVLIHGYSDEGASFRAWARELAADRDVSLLHTCSYESLTNEVTIRDIAEGFDRALRIRAGLDKDEPFDAIVHSTGMLVIRAWLAGDRERRVPRLKHLVGLAPATFGSPLAHKGRSWLGSVFKGDKTPFSPDFLEAGNRVLSGLELASPFTWDLAERDLLGKTPIFTGAEDTPWAFIFCGTERYGGIKRLASEHGTDGTVRLAGCALDSRMIRVDLTLERGRRERFVVEPWANHDAPLIPVEGKNHGTILTEPSAALVRMVRRALTVRTREDYDAWLADADVAQARRLCETLPNAWQQFIVRAVDERGDGIEDWNLQLTTRVGAEDVPLEDFDLDVHAYAADPSYRSFHVDVNKINRAGLENLWMRVIASSGSRIVGYRGEGSEKMIGEGADMRMVEDGKWDAAINLTPTLHPTGEGGAPGSASVFHPFTTTLIELKLNREPLPPMGPNKVLWFEGQRAG